MSREIIKLTPDETIIQCFENILSACLPHENNEGEEPSNLLKQLRKILHLEEVSKEHYILYKSLLKQLEIKAYMYDYKIVLTKESFDLAVQVGIEGLINDENVAVVETLRELGEEDDLRVKSAYDRASDLVYTRSLDLYEDLYKRKVSMSEAISLLEVLHSAIVQELSKEMVRTQALILNEGVEIGRKTYRGCEDLAKYVKEALVHIEVRKNNFLTGDDRFSFTDLSLTKEFTNNKEMEIRPIFKLGIKPLDSIMSIRTGDLTTIIGDEGVGKTNMAVYQLLNCVLSGLDAVMMTGESAIQKIWLMCVSRYIHITYKKKISWQEIARMEIPDEIQMLVQKAIHEMTTREDIGRIHLVHKFAYETFKSEVVELRDQYPQIGLVIVDHVDRLNSTGTLTSRGYLRNQKEKVDLLYADSIDLKIDLGLAFIFIAHTSADANKSLSRGKEVGVRIGASSSATTKDSDNVIHLSNPEHLDRQNLIRLDTKKLRDFQKAVRPIVLKKDFVCSNFIYDEELQHKVRDDDEDDLEELY